MAAFASSQKVKPGTALLPWSRWCLPWLLCLKLHWSQQFVTNNYWEREFVHKNSSRFFDAQIIGFAFLQVPLQPFRNSMQLSAIHSHNVCFCSLGNARISVPKNNSDCSHTLTEQRDNRVRMQGFGFTERKCYKEG